MTLFASILSLLAGSGVFITGMNLMSNGLQKISRKGLKRLLGKFSNNRFIGVLIGAAVTAIVQSSAATDVMVIGFVNTGAMSLFQATSIIMGANIGTTVTGLLVSLSNLNISLYASCLAFIGVILNFSKNDKIKQLGSILGGLGLIFIGLSLMSSALSETSINELFISIFNTVNFPLLLLLIGVIFTALIQSSSAMTGIVIIMVGQGVLSLSEALFIVLGANVGTCITALIATNGGNINAKRTGVTAVIIKLIGTLIFTIFIWLFLPYVTNFVSSLSNNPQIQICLTCAPALFQILFPYRILKFLFRHLAW